MRRSRRALALHAMAFCLGWQAEPQVVDPPDMMRGDEHSIAETPPVL